ncbi:MAG: GNAT family N-acetyltransferase [Thermostichus sp. HHBFW_bins_43]
MLCIKDESCLAVLGQEVVDFVCVVVTLPSTDPDDPRTDYVCVSDLFVHAGYRCQGVGRRLLEAAEFFAKVRGAEVMRVGLFPLSHPVVNYPTQSLAAG